MPVSKKAEDPQPQVRITREANKRLERIVRELNKRGHVQYKTRFVSDLILAYPIPANGNGSHPVASAEKTLTQEKQ
jgi:hypothetical protein